MLFTGELHSHEYSLRPRPVKLTKRGEAFRFAHSGNANGADKPQFVLCGLCFTILYNGVVWLSNRIFSPD